MQIDLDAETIGTNFPVSVALQADARSVVPASTAAPGETEADAGWGERVSEVAAGGRSAHRADIGADVQIDDSIRRWLPRSAVLVHDVTVPVSSADRSGLGGLAQFMD